MISQYKLDVIRQIVNELKQDELTNEWTISGKYFKDVEADYTLRFSSWSAANSYIIDHVMIRVN